MRTIFLLLLLGWSLGLLALVSCFRIPVQLVQYKGESPPAFAPVGKIIQKSATEAVMNPQVIPPEQVGPLPEPPPPVSANWTTILLGLLSGGSIGALGLALMKLRGVWSVVANLVESMQKVKEEFPLSRDAINTVLAKNQTKRTIDAVKKIKEPSRKERKK